MPAATKAAPALAVDDSDDFLSQEALEDIAQDVETRYLSPSKLPQGKSVFRFIGPGVSGYEYWIADGERSIPYRSPKKPRPEDMDPRAKTDEKTGKVIAPKRFIGGLVWDYQANAFRFLSFDQKGLITKFLEFYNNKRFGKPTNYDIEISKEGSGMTTKYDMVAYPPEPVSDEVMDEYAKLDLAPLDNYFENEEIFN
jgi:hypothetical protein